MISSIKRYQLIVRLLLEAFIEIIQKETQKVSTHGAMVIMSSISLIIFLCLASGSAIGQKVPQDGSGSENPDSHTVSAQVQILSREEQCKAKDIETVGECIQTTGNGFARTLEHRACVALWCPETDVNGKRVLCRKTANVKDYTPCSRSQVCWRESCIRVPNSNGESVSASTRRPLPPFPGGQRGPDRSNQISTASSAKLPPFVPTSNMTSGESSGLPMSSEEIDIRFKNALCRGLLRYITFIRGIGIICHDMLPGESGGNLPWQIPTYE